MIYTKTKCIKKNNNYIIRLFKNSEYSKKQIFSKHLNEKNRENWKNKKINKYGLKSRRYSNKYNKSHKIKIFQEIIIKDIENLET